MIDVTKATDTILEIAAECPDVDGACRIVQDAIGQTSGDIAGNFFSQFDNADHDWSVATLLQRVDWLREYIEIEESYARFD